MRRSARFVLTAPARDDLTEISAYIRQDSVQATHTVRAEIREAMRRLAQTPLMGHFCEDLTDEPVRFWSVYSYVIVYDRTCRGAMPDAIPMLCSYLFASPTHLTE